MLKGNYVPECCFLNELEKYPENLNDFVLIPLFSFAGLGVDIDITKENLDIIENKTNYVLQQKVDYTPLINTRWIFKSRNKHDIFMGKKMKNLCL